MSSICSNFNQLEDLDYEYAAETESACTTRPCSPEGEVNPSLDLSSSAIIISSDDEEDAMPTKLRRELIYYDKVQTKKSCKRKWKMRYRSLLRIRALDGCFVKIPPVTPPVHDRQRKPSQKKQYKIERKMPVTVDNENCSLPNRHQTNVQWVQSPEAGQDCNQTSDQSGENEREMSVTINNEYYRLPRLDLTNFLPTQPPETGRDYN